MERVPRSPIVVLGKDDDYLGVSLTARKAVVDTDGHQTPAGRSEDLESFEYFDAVGRRLRLVASEVTLVVADQDEAVDRDALRQRLARVIASRAQQLRSHRPPADLSILGLPAEDIPFELLCWRLYAVLGVEFFDESDHTSRQNSTHKLFHKLGGTHS